MKICPNCKSQNYDNAQLCFRCNYPFYNPNYYNNTQQQPYNIPVQYPNPYMNQNNVYQNNPYSNQNYYMEQQQDSPDTDKKGNKKNKVKTIIGLVLLLILLLIPSVIFLNSVRNKAKVLDITKTRIVQSTQVEATVRAVALILEKNPATPAPERTPTPKNNSRSSSSGSNSSYSSRSTQKIEYGDPHFDDVWVCTLDLVQSYLKSPRSAKFCKHYEADVTYLGNNEYMVIGYVDAQNSFGAMIRNNFVATFTLTSGGYKNGEVVFM